MPFGRLHEEAAGDSKLLALSNAAWRMWGMGLIYCQKNLTDGFIPEGAIFLWGVREQKGQRLPEVAKELCTPQVPGKEPVWGKVVGGYQVHDYLQWNDSKEEILKGRQGAKDRIARFRERDRLAREDLERRVRAAEQGGGVNADRNALQNGERHAHDVVRGSGDLKEEQGVPRLPPGHQTSGVFGGALPREHLKHAACDPTYALCVPDAVHNKLLGKLTRKHGGDRSAAGAALKAWYPTVWATLPPEFVIGDEFKFWQAQFDAAFASKAPATSARSGEPKSTVPGADRTAEYLRRQRQA